MVLWSTNMCTRWRPDMEYRPGAGHSSLLQPGVLTLQAEVEEPELASSQTPTPRGNTATSNGIPGEPEAAAEQLSSSGAACCHAK